MYMYTQIIIIHVYMYSVQCLKKHFAVFLASLINEECTILSSVRSDGAHSPEPAAGLSLSCPDVGADQFDVSPLLFQNMATGYLHP